MSGHSAQLGCLNSEHERELHMMDIWVLSVRRRQEKRAKRETKTRTVGSKGATYAAMRRNQSKTEGERHRGDRPPGDRGGRSQKDGRNRPSPGKRNRRLEHDGSIEHVHKAGQEQLSRKPSIPLSLGLAGMGTESVEGVHD